MADLNNAGASNGDGASSAEDAADSKNNAAGAQGQGEGQGADEKGGEDKSGDGKADDSKEDKASQDDDEEPQSRKSNAWYVAKRRGDKIEKITKKEGEGSGEGEGKDDKGDDDFDTKLDAALEERLSPLKKEQLEKEVDNDIASVIAAEPKFKPYAAKVRKWALHESRSHLPIESIFYEVAGKDLMKLGAEKGKEAEDEAKRSQGSGGGNSAEEASAKNVWEMTSEEFEAQKQRVRSGQSEA